VAWRRGVFTAVICGDILRDVGDALVDLGEPTADVEDYLVDIGSGAELVPISHQRMGVRDLNDDMLLETAICGRADYLVTYDKDLHELTPSVAAYVAGTASGYCATRDGSQDEVDFCSLLRELGETKTRR